MAAKGPEIPMPNLFDGTTRLYVNALCPYAQRVVIAANYKGLNDIEHVEINLSNKPKWYGEKVYPVSKVPALEHAGKVMGESLDLLTYLEKNFKGIPLLPEDDGKKELYKELSDFSDEFVKTGFSTLSSEELSAAEVDAKFGPLLDRLDTALSKYAGEGPFFLGTFSAADCVFAPFLERFSVAFKDVHKSAYDITQSRSNLASWMQALDGVKAYTDTKVEKSALKALYEKMLAMGYFKNLNM